MIKFSGIFLLTVVVSLTSVHASGEDCHYSEFIKPIMEECFKEFGITRADIVKAKENGRAEDLKPCFLSCVFKKVGILDDKGKFDIDTFTSTLPKYVKDEMYDTYVEIGKKCTSVNDEPVSDGDAGCDRAMLLTKCYMEHKSELLM